MKPDRVAQRLVAASNPSTPFISYTEINPLQLLTSQPDLPTDLFVHEEAIMKMKSSLSSSNSTAIHTIFP